MMEKAAMLLLRLYAEICDDVLPFALLHMG